MLVFSLRLSINLQQSVNTEAFTRKFIIIKWFAAGKPEVKYTESSLNVLKINTALGIYNAGFTLTLVSVLLNWLFVVLITCLL